MIEFLTSNFVPMMFTGLLVFLLMGFPVSFSLAATGLFFGLIGMELELFPSNLFQALPLRVFGIMQNDTLLAIPFFTLMGIILERSRMAEDLLSTVAQVFGPVRGGLAVAVIMVGALLAATTGVVAAAVISMGLISLPIMLRYGYNRTIATGTITASGTLAQALPPSLVLIVLADQLGRSVGDMYAGALIPGLMLVGLYLLFIAVVAIVLPKWVPALPREARIYTQPNGATGHRSLLALLQICGGVTYLWSLNHEAIINPLIERETTPGGDEVLIISSQRLDNQIELIVAVDLDSNAAAPAVSAAPPPLQGSVRENAPDDFVPFAKLFHDASAFGPLGADGRPVATHRTVPLVAVPTAAVPPNSDRSPQQALPVQAGQTDAQQLRHESQRSQEIVELLRLEIAAMRKEFSLSRQMMPWQDGLRLPPAIQQVSMAMIEAGVPVGVMFAPVIPWVNDHELEAVLEAAREAGATAAGYVLLRLPHEVAPLFRDWLQTHLPDRAAHVMSTVQQLRGGKDYDSRFGTRLRGEGVYADLLARRFALALKRHGFAGRRHPPFDVTRFVPPRAPSPQGELF